MTSTLTRPHNADSLSARLPGLAVAGPLSHTTVSPLDGQPIAQLPLADEAAVERAFSTARVAFESWSALPARDRIATILKFHDALLKRQTEILDIVQWENGKSRSNAMDEILDVALTCRYYAATAEDLLRPKRRRGAFPIVTVTEERMHPHGVIGVISPWNYPLTLAVSDFIPALIAGNTVVLKPDLQTSLTALWAINLLRESGVPEQVVQVVLGEGADVGPHIVARADYVMFTGSTRAGRIVAAQAAERLIGSSMELGGKNSLIVDKSVDVDFAAEIAARGAFANAGQLCIGTERIVVHQDVYDKFVAAFATKVSNLKVGAAIGWGADLGTLTHPRQLATTQQHVADAVERGATILVGGEPLPELSPLAFQPTVLTNVPEDALACREETFGPVCSLYRWSDERDLVKFVNNTPYGLNAAIISKDLKFAYRLAPLLKVGTVNINEAFGSAYASIDAPMGGMGQSGLGRRHGAYGLLKYTEPQTISRQRWMKLSPQWNLDDAGWAKFTTLAMRLLKFLGFR